MQNLNPDRMPPSLLPLLPMAERWGIGDDHEREMAVSKASLKELEELILCIAPINDDDLYGWLGGPESYNPKPSKEYTAITALTMAIDSAKLKLNKMRSK